MKGTRLGTLESGLLAKASLDGVGGLRLHRFSGIGPGFLFSRQMHFRKSTVKLS
jgi:hypothetical protein